MELVIFEELDFNIGFAMPIQFLRRLSQTSQDDVDGLKDCSWKNFNLMAVELYLAVSASLNNLDIVGKLFVTGSLRLGR